MISVSGKYWEEIQVAKRLIDKVSNDHDLTHIQSKLILSRNYSLDEIYSIKNNFELINPFLKNKDFLNGCDLLKKNIDNNNKILVIGDYDVDGCISTALFVNFLKKNKADFNYYIPDRFKDGYGASKDLISHLLSKFKPSLIIFLDCGSNSHEALKYINNLNKKSLIIDHHNIEQPYPLSEVFINPKKKIGYNNHDYLCTAFLTYFFLEVYLNINKIKISLKKNYIYVLLATVADVMPLRKLNRILAINTIKNFKINDIFIFDYLSKILNINKKIEIDELAYLIAPIFNAAGRLENANQIIELLSTDKKEKIINILDHIYKLNSKRKLIEKNVLDKLNLNKLSNQEGVIFVFEPNISEGIIGIIASKLKDYFSKPCIVLTNSGKNIKGSARSTPNFNIGTYIQKAVDKKILLKGGGHNLAAGITLIKSNIEPFQRYLNLLYKNKTSNIANYFISKISLNAVNRKLVNDLKKISPFGHQNVNPIFFIENVKLIKPTLMKKKFISCYIKSSNKSVKAVSFQPINSKISDNIFNSKKNANVLVKIKENKWNNKNLIQLEIIDLI